MGFVALVPDLHLFLIVVISSLSFSPLMKCLKSSSYDHTFALCEAFSIWLVSCCTNAVIVL
jgi:hypothetical protein